MIVRLGLDHKLIEYTHPSKKFNRIINPYIWQKVHESKQIRPCIAWLKKNVNLPSNLTFCNLSTKRDALNLPANFYNLPFTLKGTADVVVVDKRYAEDAKLVIREFCMIIELKKEVCTRDQNQAIAELIASNGISTNPVVTVLTDLNSSWHFYWLQEQKQFAEYVCEDLISAIMIMQSIFTDDNTLPFTQRVSLPVSLGFRVKGEKTTLTFEEVIEMIKKRPKVKAPGETGDVAPMEDVFDVMTSEEITEWRLKQWGRVLTSTPWLDELLLKG